jgi:hypothetical protein
MDQNILLALVGLGLTAAGYALRHFLGDPAGAAPAAPAIPPANPLPAAPSNAAAPLPATNPGPLGGLLQGAEAYASQWLQSELTDANAQHLLELLASRLAAKYGVHPASVRLAPVPAPAAATAAK